MLSIRSWVVNQTLKNKVMHHCYNSWSPTIFPWCRGRSVVPSWTSQPKTTQLRDECSQLSRCFRDFERCRGVEPELHPSSSTPGRCHHHGQHRQHGPHFDVLHEGGTGQPERRRCGKDPWFFKKSPPGLSAVCPLTSALPKLGSVGVRWHEHVMPTKVREPPKCPATAGAWSPGHLQVTKREQFMNFIQLHFPGFSFSWFLSIYPCFSI